MRLLRQDAGRYGVRLENSDRRASDLGGPRDPDRENQAECSKQCNSSVTGGDRAGVALSEPLNGGSPEVRVTGPGELQEGCKGIRPLELAL